MPTVVVLHHNIFDEEQIKRVRGDQFEASNDFIKAVKAADKKAKAPERITVVKPTKANEDK